MDLQTQNWHEHVKLLTMTCFSKQHHTLLIILQKLLWCAHRFTYFLLKQFGSSISAEVLHDFQAVFIYFFQRFISLQIHPTLWIYEWRQTLFKCVWVHSSFPNIVRLQPYDIFSEEFLYDKIFTLNGNRSSHYLRERTIKMETKIMELHAEISNL